MKKIINFFSRKNIFIPVIIVGMSSMLYAAEKSNKINNDKTKHPSVYTEVWQPKVPIVHTSKTGQPPSDAIVLFDGSDLSEWKMSKGGDAKWDLDTAKKIVTVKPKTGAMETRRTFCDVQLHIEWRTPPKILGKSGQQLGNSGIFMQTMYEIQILDSHNNETYSNGQAASIYKQHIPQVNATRPPGEWQDYDIIYTAPRFTKKGRIKTPAKFTVLHNGVLVLHNVELQGPTVFIGAPHYAEPHGCLPIKLQDHKDLVSFRNIWVRELD